MKDTKEYNGYANWATWNVALWMHNEEGPYKATVSALNTALISANKIKIVKDVFQAFFGSKTPDMETAKEMIDVDWQEVAGSFLEDIEEGD